MGIFKSKRRIAWFGKVASLVGACAIAFLLAVSVLPLSGSDTADAAESTGTSGKTDWMKDIEDKIYVSHLSIPGSHQAAAWNPRGNTRLFARCQDASFTAQLNAGLRAFDIRYKWVGGANPASWYLYHGEDSWHYELQNDDNVHMDIFYFLDQVTAWLKAHPTEFIIVNFQKEMGDAWTDTEYKEKILARYGGSASDNYASGTIIPYWNATSYNQLKVGDVRGRIIDGSKFMQGVSGDYNSWKTPFNNKVQQLNRCFDNAPAISKSNSSTPNYIEQKVIYSNLACNAAGGVDLTYPETYAKEMRKYLFTYNVFTNGSKNGTLYENRGQKAYGIVLYDYVTQDQNCIDYNVQANDWAKKQVFKVTFNTNGAEQTITTQNIQEYEGVDFPWKSLTKAGYTFLGWYTDAACKKAFKFASNNGNNTQNPANQIYTTGYDVPTSNMTLYAGWAKNTYKITYALNGGALKAGDTNPDTYNYGQVTGGFASPEKIGYKFDGWYSDVNCTKKVDEISATTLGDITLYAKWTANTYAISYQSELGGYSNPNPQNFTYLADEISLQPASKDGYVFLGWCDQLGNLVTTVSTNVTNDITLYAKWEKVDASITYYNLEGVSQAQVTTLPTEYTYSATEDIVLPELTKEHYTFDGWYADANFTQVANTIAAGTAGAVERYAKWTADSFNITYELGTIKEGEEASTKNPNPATYSYGQGVEKLEDASKYGGTFQGWYTDEACTEGNEVTSIAADETGDKVFYAKWTSRLNKITYMYGYDNPNPTEFYYADGITLQPAKRDGYTFSYWTVVPNMKAFAVEKINPYQTSGDIILYATWEANTYNITYVDNDGNELNDTGNPATYTCGTGVTALKNPADREGKKFAGWYVDPSDTTTKTTSISKDTWGDIKLIAIFTEDGEYEYTITYDYADGQAPKVANPTTYIRGYGVAKFNAPTKEHYDFAGWQDESGNVVESIATDKTGNISLKATWKPKVYTITYDTDGGDVIENTTYTYGTTVDTLPTPERQFSKFVGWYKEDGTKVEGISATDGGDIKLIAHWDSEKFNITYVDGEGSPAEYTYGTGLDSLSTPVKENYTFDGWHDGETIIASIPKDRSGDITLTAQWSPAKYKINYELSGGEQTGNPEVYTYGIATTIPNEPTRAGYDFKGWKCGDADFTEIAAGTSGEVTITAQWGLKDYKITYDYNGGIAPQVANPETYRFSEGVALLNSPTKENYNFAGWTIDGEKVSGVDATRSGDLTLVATWSPKVFNVTYDYAGGEATTLYNSNQYTYGTGIEELYDAKREFYAFGGWKVEGTDEIVSSIPATATGDYKLVAVWTAEVYKIEYELYGGKIEAGNPTSYTYGEGAVITKQPTKENFTFGGWSYNGVIDNDGTLTLGVATSGDVQLYAHWIPDSYSISYVYGGGSEGSENRNIAGTVQTVTNPKEYSYGEGVSDLIDAVPAENSNTKFAGWYLNGEKVDSIPSNQTGNVVLVAKWVRASAAVQLASVNGSGTVSVNGTPIQVGITRDVEDGEDLTISWTPTTAGSTDISIIKSIKVNGVDQDAFTKIDKTMWQTTNTDYQERMNETSDVQMITYENILSTEQSLTVGVSSLASLASLNDNIYSVEVEFQTVTPVYRMYNMITSEHLFTTNKSEYDSFDTQSKARTDYWVCEGIEWLAPSETEATADSKTVYRLYNASLGNMGHSSHYYTSDVAEMTDLVNNHGWTVDEGNGFMSGGDYAIYTCYNEALGSAHHYTSSKTEWEGLSAHGWDLERDKNGFGKTGAFSATLSAK